MIIREKTENGTINVTYKREPNKGIDFLMLGGQEATPETIEANIHYNRYLLISVNTNVVEEFTKINTLKLILKTTEPNDEIELYLHSYNEYWDNNGLIGKFKKINDLEYEIDILSEVLKSQNGIVFLGVNSNVRCCISLVEANFPKLIVNQLEYKDCLKKGKHLTGKVGNKLIYDVDLRFGNLILEKNLYQFEGCLMPMKLSLKYNSYKANREPIQSGLPSGWKFNCYKKIEVGTNSIIYIDENGVDRKFVPSNNVNKYYEENGSGLTIVKNIDGSYQMNDGTNQFIDFKPDGLIHKLKKKIGNTLLQTIFNYDSTGKLISITDQMGNIVEFLYMADREIYVTCSNRPDFRVNILNEKLNSILENNTRNTSFSYGDNFNITSVSYDDTEKAEFTFDNNKRVISITNKICKNNNSNIVSKYNLEYTLGITEVIDYKNICTTYTFDEEGLLISEAEKNSSTFSGLIVEPFKRLLLSTKSSNNYVLSSNIYNFEGETTDSNGTAITKEEVLEELTDNFDFEALTDYLVNFSCVLDGTSTESTPYRHTYLAAYQNGRAIGGVEIELKNLEPQSLQFIITTLDDSKPVFKLVHVENVGIVNISNVYVCKNYINIRRMCLNRVSVGGHTETTPILSDDGHWYALKDVFQKISYIDSTGARIFLECKVYEEDLRDNLKNFALSSSGTYDIWYNKRRVLLSGVKDVMLYFDDSNCYSIGELKMCICTETDDGYSLEYDDYSNTGSVTNILKTTYNKICIDNIITSSHVIVSRDYLPLETVDYDGNKTIYQYNSYGNLLTERFLSTNSSLCMEKAYQYSQDYKWLIKEIRQSAKGEISTTSYEYTNGLVTKAVLPNGLIVRYYYGIDEKIIKITYSDGNTISENNLLYEKDLVQNLSHSGNIGYELSYDNYNLLNSVMTDYHSERNNFMTINNALTTDVNEIEYINGDGSKVKYTYDKYGNLIKISRPTSGIYSAVMEYYYSECNVEDIVTYNDPNSLGLLKSQTSKLRKIVDKKTGNIAKIKYNLDGNVTQVMNSGESNVSESNFYYDNHQRLINSQSNVFDINISKNYTYRDDGLKPTSDIESIVVDVSHSDDNLTFASYEHSNTLDNLKRVSTEIRRIEDFAFETVFSYKTVNNVTTTFPSNIMYVQHDYTSDDSTLFGDISYKYNNMNNITSVIDTFSENSITYDYDLFGRLIRENNEKLAKSYRYTYDNKGNIIKKEEGSYTIGTFTPTSTINYLYSTTYPDRLTSYNGQVITYDSNGNVTKIGSKILTWSKGKQLDSVKISVADTYTYNYDGDGRRIRSRSSGVGIEHKYVYEGNKILKKIVNHPLKSMSYTLTFIYANEEIIGFIKNEEKFMFIKNLQHDIIGIVDSTGNVVAKYVYDAWGNHKVYQVSNGQMNLNTSETFIGNVNPFRYRGYYYDVETGLFWLSSRYYSPELGRFIQPADVSSLNPSNINGLNLYAYANNNPISIVYSSSNVGVSGLSNGGMVSSIDSSVGGLNSGYYGTISNSSNIFGALGALSTAFGFFDQWSGYIVGGLDGGLGFFGPDGFGFKGLGKYSDALGKFGKIMAITGGIISWGNSAYNNFTNPNYTTGEAFGASVMDAAYYGGTGVLKYKAGLAIGSFAINAGIAVGASILIGAPAMWSAGLVVGLSIAAGGLVAIGIGLAGAVAIYYIGEGVDWLYGKFKEWIFE